MSEIIETLTVEEASEFAKLDKTIKAGASAFLSVGKALVRMHEGKLYRAKFKTFQEYAESRGLSRRAAYRMLEAVQMTMALADENVPTLAQKALVKSNENTFVELAKVPKADRPKVLAAAVEATGGKLTAPAIAQAAAKEDHRATPVLTHPVNRVAPVLDVIEATPPAAITPLPAIPTKGHITPAQFQEVLDQLAARILPGEHKKFGQIANRWTDKLMNWGAEQKTGWAYGQ